VRSRPLRVSRWILIGAAVLALLSGAWWAMHRNDEVTLAPAAAPAPAPQRPSPPRAPSTLRATLAGFPDAKVEVTPRGAAGQFDVRAQAGNQLALAVVRLAPGEQLELELQPQPQSTLDVSLFDTDKLPVDRAYVTAQHLTTGFIIKARSDSDGTVAFGPVAGGEWAVSASREGWATGAAVVTAGRPGGRITMPMTTWLPGQTYPAGALVRVALATPEHVSIAELVSDGGAPFRLGPLPAGRYELEATADGFEPRREPVELPSSFVMLKLSVGAVVKGELTEKLDATVTLDGPGGTRTVAARRGLFEARGLAAGRWRFSSGLGRTDVELDGGVTRVTIDLPRHGGVIAGSCGFDGGHRLPAQVTVRATAEDGSLAVSAGCDAGQFELGGLPAGFYAVEVDAVEGGERHHASLGSISTGPRDVAVRVPGVAWLRFHFVNPKGVRIDATETEHYQSGQQTLSKSAEGLLVFEKTIALERGRDLDLGAISLMKGARVSGRVLDATTKDPIAGAKIFSRVTGADGTFVTDEAPPGGGEVTVACPGYVTVTRWMDPGEEATIELQRAARAVGGLVTADGSAPEGLEVRAYLADGGAVVAAAVESGTFATPHLTEGRWLLRVVPEGGAPVSAFDTVELDVKGAGDRRVWLIERAAGVSFDAVVVDKSGAPTESELFLVPRPSPAPANQEELEALLRRPGLIADLTGKSARYRFRHVPPGAYTLLASARGRVWTLAVPVAVVPGMMPVRVAYEQVRYSP
jgi:hypothetical protein